MQGSGVLNAKVVQCLLPPCWHLSQEILQRLPQLAMWGCGAISARLQWHSTYTLRFLTAPFTLERILARSLE